MVDSTTYPLTTVTTKTRLATPDDGGPETVITKTITTHKPIPLTPDDFEPPLGSVLMLASDSGTAVQRFYRDGRYYGAGGAVYDSFEDLFGTPSHPRAVYLVYVPPTR